MENKTGLMSATKSAKSFAETGEQYIEAVYQKLPPKDKGAVERAVVAGMKIMFSPQTHKYMLETLSGDGELSAKLSTGIIQLVILLHQKTKGAIPMNVMMPAAAILLVRAGEYVDKTEGGMNMDVFGESLKLMVAGVTREVQKMYDKQGGQGTQPMGGV